MVAVGAAAAGQQLSLALPPPPSPTAPAMHVIPVAACIHTKSAVS